MMDNFTVVTEEEIIRELEILFEKVPEAIEFSNDILKSRLSTIFHQRNQQPVTAREVRRAKKLVWSGNYQQSKATNHKTA